MNEEIDLPYDLVLPTKLALSKDIDSDHKFLYALIRFRCSTRGYIWHENKTLAKNMNKSTRSIERGLKALREAKWLHIEQRVKKDDLYEQDHRRVIWIYSEYLLAQDKNEPYIAVKPLSYSKWKTRVINAVADDSKSNLVLYFYEIMHYLGKKKMTISPSDKRIFHTISMEDDWDSRPASLTTQEINTVFNELYEYYKSLFIKPPTDPLATRFSFIKHIRASYKHNSKDKIFPIVHKTITGDYMITPDGLLFFSGVNGIENYNKEEANKIWDWLYELAKKDELIHNVKGED